MRVKNTRSLSSYKGKLEARIAKYDPMPNLIMIREFKLDSVIADNDLNINLTGYSLIRRDREDESGCGSCLIFSKNTIPLKRMNDLEPPDCEMMITSVEPESRETGSCILYRPPDKDSEAIWWYTQNLDDIRTNTITPATVLSCDYDAHNSWLESKTRAGS